MTFGLAEYSRKIPQASYPPVPPPPGSSPDELYEWACAQENVENGDTNRYALVLRAYARGCDHVTELGMRHGVSTAIFLSAQPAALVSYDVEPQPCVQVFQSFPMFEFRQESSLTCRLQETDLLFIDTDHTYQQLAVELARHSLKVRKYIIMHDTKLPPLRFAVMEFLRRGTFRFRDAFYFGADPLTNGLTVLEKI